MAVMEVRPNTAEVILVDPLAPLDLRIQAGINADEPFNEESYAKFETRAVQIFAELTDDHGLQYPECFSYLITSDDHEQAAYEQFVTEFIGQYADSSLSVKNESTDKIDWMGHIRGVPFMLHKYQGPIPLSNGEVKSGSVFSLYRI